MTTAFRRWAMLIILGVAAAQLFIYQSSLSQNGPSATMVRVEEARFETMQARFKVTGNLRARSRANVAALEEGRVVSVEVIEGDIVKRGDPLARIDARRLNAQLNETLAERNKLDAERDGLDAALKNARWNLERLRPLWESQMTTEQNLRDAETAVVTAEANIAANRREYERVSSRIDLLRIRIEDAVMYAPFEGRVIERHVEPGEWISPGSPIVTLISHGRIEAWLSVPERFTYAVSQFAQQLTIDLLDGQETLPSDEIRMIPDIDPRSRTFWLAAALYPEEIELAPGMSISAWIPTGVEAEFMSVSKDAIIRDSAGSFLYKAQSMPSGGYTAIQVPLRVEFEAQGRAAITSDLLEVGDLVVIEGNERLLPMTPIIPFE